MNVTLIAIIGMISPRKNEQEGQILSEKILGQAYV